MYTSVERAPGTQSVAFRRWVLAASRWLRLVVHRVMPGASEDVIHNHASGFLSVILRGGYTEEVWHGEPWAAGERWSPKARAEWRAPDDVAVRRAGSVRLVRREEVHRIDDVLPGTLTLLISIGPCDATTVFSPDTAFKHKGLWLWVLTG
jgi:hypothetical protein